MLTIEEIVKNHIQRTAALAGNMPAMIAEAKRAEARMLERMASDPALSLFVTHYAEGLAGALKATPKEIHALMLKSMLMQVVTEWEDINLEFNKSIGGHEM